MHDRESAAVWRERVQLTHTIKDGWRVGEVTVECTYQEGDRPAKEVRQARLRAAIEDGQVVAERKNRDRRFAETLHD